MTKNTKTTTKKTTAKTTATKKTAKTVSKTPVKAIPVNTELNITALMGLVSRVDSIQKADIAEQWVKENKVVSATEKCELLAMVNFKKAVLYSNLSKSIKLSNAHKITISGVRELKVG